MIDFAELIGWVRSWPAAKVAIDAADVLIVAVVFYRLLVLVRGTRAMQMAIGLFFVFLVYHFARYIGLISLYAILDTLLTSIVVLIVVIFQNDIRRLLARVGQRPLIRGVRSAREVQAIEDVVKATSVLAQRHIGALIVFERNASLEEFVEHGTEIDSELTKEILYALFVASPDNPLHDGAVIVREGRIWQAGCHLPLSGSSKLDRSLGTRHRAAIGISEETDAVVVAVSEERGSVSLCFNGNMVRGLETADLRHALLGLFQAPARKKTREATTKRAGTGERPSSAGRPAVPRAATKGGTASASTSSNGRERGTERQGASATPGSKTLGGATKTATSAGSAGQAAGSAGQAARPPAKTEEPSLSSESSPGPGSPSQSSTGPSSRGESPTGPSSPQASAASHVAASSPSTESASAKPPSPATSSSSTSSPGQATTQATAEGAKPDAPKVQPAKVDAARKESRDDDRSGPDRLSSADVGAPRERAVSKEERP